MGRKRLVWNIFFLAPGIDDGDVIDSRTIQINEWDDASTLYYKIAVIVKKMFIENIPKIFRKEVKPIPQTGAATFYEKRTP